MKKHLFLLVAFVLPIFMLSAHEGGGRGGGQRNMGHAQQHAVPHYNQGNYSHHNGYGGYGGYGGGSGGGYYGAPVDPESQPGMSDDSDSLYHSYQRMNPH